MSAYIAFVFFFLSCVSAMEINPSRFYWVTNGELADASGGDYTPAGKYLSDNDGSSIDVAMRLLDPENKYQMIMFQELGLIEGYPTVRIGNVGTSSNGLWMTVDTDDFEVTMRRETGTDEDFLSVWVLVDDTSAGFRILHGITGTCLDTRPDGGMDEVYLADCTSVYSQFWKMSSIGCDERVGMQDRPELAELSTDIAEAVQKIDIASLVKRIKGYGAATSEKTLEPATEEAAESAE